MVLYKFDVSSFIYFSLDELFSCLFCFVVIIFYCRLIYGIGLEIKTTINLKSELAEDQERLEKVKEEKEYLITQKSKLEDPNYVQSYARGNYTMTKEGEKIYYLPPKDK